MKHLTIRGYQIPYDDTQPYLDVIVNRFTVSVESLDPADLAREAAEWSSSSTFSFAEELDSKLQYLQDLLEGNGTLLSGDYFDCGKVTEEQRAGFERTRDLYDTVLHSMGHARKWSR